MIEQAEYVLRDLGFYDVRVRHHELNSGLPVQETEVDSRSSRSATPNSQVEAKLSLARIEVGAAELPRLLANGLAGRVADELKKVGYAHVTVDLQGYRRGSLNEGKVAARPPAAVS
jgi:pyridinium-3,5-biscarboxylic acid mononucleotide sulfurtransferase